MTYDIKKVSVIVDGRHLTGFSEDTKVSAEREEEGILAYVGVDGDVDHSINSNNSGEITVPLKGTSPSVSYLNRLANTKKLVPVTVIDLNENGINASATEAFVAMPMYPEKGVEISEVEFALKTGDLTIE